MSLFQLFLFAAILALLLVSAMHSVLGERRLLVPMFERRGNPVLDSDLARLVLRFAWHATSVMWVMLAVILAAVVLPALSLEYTVLYAMAASFLLCGVIDGVITRFRHIGWSVLTAIGIFCLGAALVGVPHP